MLTRYFSARRSWRNKWDDVDPQLRPERAILGLRKGLGLYANLRPVQTMDELIAYSPLKPDIVRGTDVLIVRELIGGIYFGDKCEQETYKGTVRAWDLENYSIPEVERIVDLAMQAAMKRKGRVTSVDKANVFSYFTSVAQNGNKNSGKVSSNNAGTYVCR